MTQYRSRWPKELDLNQGNLIQVLFKEDETWWFGRLTNGNEGYFPAACVEPLQVTTLTSTVISCEETFSLHSELQRLKVSLTLH